MRRDALWELGMSFDTREAVRVEAENEADSLRPVGPHRSSIIASQLKRISNSEALELPTCLRDKGVHDAV